ncbi:MAG: DUF484 family protein [Proteobacteria bacterium]|nr:DUF484 family protein [Pseudomonadota bacterium]
MNKPDPKTKRARIKKEQITDAQVADYLLKHREFFKSQEKLLLEMDLPHVNGKAISLVERQVSLLRERNVSTRKKLDEFVASAKRNNEIFEKCRKLILALIDAEDPDQFFAALENSFKKDFHCDAYSLIIFSDTPHQINHFTTSVSEMAAKDYIGSLIRAKQPTLGVLRPSEQDFLFRHQSSKVGSAAVLSVRKNRQIALLAIGSEDANYFKAGMGTVFIGFVADTLAKLIPRHIYLKHQ